MIRYIIKNNLKLMLRNKWIIFVMVFCPVLVSAILSSAFADLMKSYEGVEDFKVGYRMEEGSLFAAGIDMIKEAGKEAGITFAEYPSGVPKEVMENNNLAGFVTFGSEKYTLYQSADYEVEGITLEYFLSTVLKESEKMALQAAFPALTEEQAETEGIDATSQSLPVAQLDFLPAIDAGDYYGIVYIVYFSWCGIICVAGVLNNEKKYGIMRKYQVSALSDGKQYLGKWIPTTLVVSVGIGISAVMSSLLFDISWGNAGMAIVILVLSIMASSAFGLMLYYIFHNLAITIIALFTSVWFMGFFGGSFETYMFAVWSDSVKNLSPVYHVNRALVENACMGHSAYTESSIIYMLAITGVCSAIAIMADKIRKRGRA